MQQLTLSVVAGPTAPAIARRKLRRALDGLAEEVVDDILLLTTEIVTNSLRYGSVEPKTTVHVALTRSLDSVRVAVTDPGRGDMFTPHLADPRSTGGRGLLLVAEMSDRWGIERAHTTTVWFERSLAPRVDSRTG